MLVPPPNDIYLEMNRRYSIAVTRRRSSIRVLEGRNRISPGVDYDDDSDFFDLETAFVLAKMRTMSPEEASAYAAQAVAEAELAMVEAAEALREAEAAEAEAQAATAQAAATFAAAFKKMKARNTRKRKPCSEESGTRVGQLEEPPSD